MHRNWLQVAVAVMGCLGCGYYAVQGWAAEPPPAKSRLGMNLSGPADWNTEHPFVDVFRLSRKWISQRKGAAWGKGPELQRDAQGWIKQLEPDCWAETPLLTGGHAPRGEYVCLYQGDGELSFGHNAKVVSKEPGRVVVQMDPSAGGTFLQLKRTNAQDYVRNIRVLMPGFEKTARSAPFHPGFLERWRGFNTFRFMDWQETNGSRQRDWADRPKLDDCNWTEKGVPVEAMVALCNQLKINPWFCTPHEAGDDYVRQFAQLVKQRLDPALTVYVENSNEVWNGMFLQHRYAEQKAKELGLGPKARPWEGAAMFYARRSVEMFRIWETAFGGRERLVRVIAWQAAGGDYWSDKMVLAHEGAGQNCDALAIAPYITMCIGPNTKPNANEVAGWSLDKLLDHVEQRALPESLGWIQTQKKVADKYNLKLIAYEAGQHLVGVGGGENNEPMTRLFHSANRHPRMGTIYTKYLDGWRDSGGDLLCIFASTGSWSKWGSWGLLEFADQTESDIPKCQAVLQWNRKNLRP
jgi:hypothetical protein